MMKQFYFIAFFVTIQMNIQAQILMKEKYIGTWVSKDTTGNKSMFFIGKNNEFIWTDINEPKILMYGRSWATRIGRYEVNKDTLIITLNKILHFSTNTGAQRSENCEVNSQKWLLRVDSNTLSVLKKYPDFATLYNDPKMLIKNSKTFENDRKFYVPNAPKYEKTAFDFLKTEACKHTYWQDLIDLVCK